MPSQGARLINLLQDSTDFLSKKFIFAQFVVRRSQSCLASSEAIIENEKDSISLTFGHLTDKIAKLLKYSFNASSRLIIVSDSLFIPFNAGSEIMQSLKK